MFTPRFGLPLAALLLAAFLLLAPTRSAQAAPTSIVYVGQLLTSTSPPTAANGSYDFQFQLFNAATGGSQVGPTVSLASVPVVNGVYQVQLSFGNVFTGQTLWLQISDRVHPASGSPAYTALTPRMVAPNSAFADYATLSGSTQGLQTKAVSTAYPTSGQVLTYNGTLWAPATPASGGTYTAGTGLTLSGSKFAVAVPLSLTGTSGPIISATNTGSTTGSLGGNFYGVFGSGTGINTGVRGENTSSGAGVTGFTASGYGVYGSSSGAGYGVTGSSAGGTGVSGTSTSGVAGSFTGGGTSISHPVLQVSNTNSSGIGIVSNTNSNDANLILGQSGTGDLIKCFGANYATPFRVTAGGTTITSVLQITGGSDVAEPYVVGASDGVTPLPGMVVSIDPAKIGQMTVARGAYTQTVAGIVSGAGGIQPGLTLRQKGSVADGGPSDGGLPVACTGRVWCWCDADANGAIKAGDLLTTSDTPGHAMKATDASRSRGAILGKAMSPLASGKGLVLVLVTLE